jgi:hypothetical protein
LHQQLLFFKSGVSRSDPSKLPFYCGQYKAPSNAIFQRDSGGVFKLDLQTLGLVFSGLDLGKLPEEPFQISHKTTRRGVRKRYPFHLSSLPAQF